MKKWMKILIIVIAAFIALGITFCCVDTSKIRKGERPIFCYDASGGSIILYYGLGYTIHGAYDDAPGGLENAKVDTWIGYWVK